MHEFSDSERQQDQVGAIDQVWGFIKNLNMELPKLQEHKLNTKIKVYKAITLAKFTI